MRDLVPWSGIEPGPPALGSDKLQSPDHQRSPWTCNFLDYWVTDSLCHSGLPHRARMYPCRQWVQCKAKPTYFNQAFPLFSICAFLKNSLSSRTCFFPFILSCFQLWGFPHNSSPILFSQPATPFFFNLSLRTQKCAHSSFSVHSFIQPVSIQCQALNKC